MVCCISVESVQNGLSRENKKSHGNPQNLRKISIIESSYLRKNVISSKMLGNFPNKLKNEMLLIASAACPENLAEKDKI